MVDLGTTISQISELTPGGILIFFPSYYLLEKSYESWENNGSLLKIEKFKKVFREPKDASKYEAIIQNYYKNIFNPPKNSHLTGAILLGVCRGKISEGMDFSDKAARCVIMVGIPYP
jgi:Rad3-related DNA helicase